MRWIDLLDYLFPRFCLNCRFSGSYLCESCREELVLLKMQSCPHCRKNDLFGLFCSAKCRANYFFDQLVVCFDYNQPIFVRKLISIFKYKFSEDLAQLFGQYMRTQFAKFLGEIEGYDRFFIVPVPLHQKRYRFRGFNQAELLSKIMITDFEEFMFYCDCLERTEYRPEQAKLSKHERQINLRGSIKLAKNFKDSLKGSSVLLIDDIATTCSTLNECSRALKEAGVNYICCLTLARAKLFC